MEEYPVVLSSTEKKFLQELHRLIELGEKVLSTQSKWELGVSYDDKITFQWKVSGLSFLERVFGQSSDYYREFSKVFEAFNTSAGQRLERAQGVLASAKDGIESGALLSTKTLIQAEIFSDLLEQAEYLQKSGYSLPAAVLTGAVLEDGLRKLCENNSVKLPQRSTINPMNDELAKAGVYSGLVKKQITAIADLRNKAAHGKTAEFSSKDVEVMLDQVRDILGKYLS